MDLGGVHSKKGRRRRRRASIPDLDSMRYAEEERGRRAGGEASCPGTFLFLNVLTLFNLNEHKLEVNYHHGVTFSFPGCGQEFSGRVKDYQETA